MITLLLPLQLATAPAAPPRLAQRAPTQRPRRNPGDIEPADDGEVMLRIPRRRQTATTTRTAAAEARQLPGTQGDAVRVVESLPGIGRASFGAGELIVWGGAPGTSRAYVDGVPIPQLFHGAGLRSTINGFFVGNIELVPGAYGAEFGRALAGMVQIDTAPAREGFHGYASVDLLDASAAASVSLGARTTLSAGFRRGWIDALVPLVASQDALQYLSIPSYNDWQLRLEHRPSEYGRLSVMVFGSDDAQRNTFAGSDPSRVRTLERASSYQRVVARYTQTQDGARLAVTGWAGRNLSARGDAVGAYPSDVSAEAIVGGLRASWLRTLTPWARLHAGIDAEFGVTDMARRGSLLRPAREGDVTAFGQPPTPDLASDTWTVRQVQIAPFVELPLSFFNDRLTLTAGLRLECALTDVSKRFPVAGDTPAFGSAGLRLRPEPRLVAVARVHPRVQLKLGAGLYHSAPRPEDLSAVFGTPTLDVTQSMQLVGGVTVQLTTAISVEALGFVRALDDVPARVAATSPRVGEALTQTGSALAYGGQLTVRHAPYRGFTAWASYTITRSEVTDRPGADARLSDYDQTHLVTAVGSYQLPLGFSVGLRFRLMSGLPRTPVVGRYYDALSGDYQPLFGAVNSDRLPMTTSLDLRVDRRFRVGGGEIVVFLDVLNLLNRPIAEEYLWDATWSQRGLITGLPILADLGVRGEW